MWTYKKYKWNTVKPNQAHSFATKKDQNYGKKQNLPKNIVCLPNVKVC